jgi:hypothetical protein
MPDTRGNRTSVGFLLTTVHPYLVLDDDAGLEQMFNARAEDIEYYRRTQRLMREAELELLEGIEVELTDLIKSKPPVRNRAAHNRYQRAKTLKARLQELRRRQD